MEITPNDVILIIGAASAALVSIFVAIQKSRCYHIECLCVKCLRRVKESPAPSPKECVDIVNIA
jgi:hypothetical protein